MKPFIYLTSRYTGEKVRVMIASMTAWGKPHPSFAHMGHSYVECIGETSGDERMFDESPAEIDALVEAALADQQAAIREPQAALPRTDEPQDPIARLEAWRKGKSTRHWLVGDSARTGLVTASLYPSNDLSSVVGFEAESLSEAVSLALAAAKEAGHG